MNPIYTVLTNPHLMNKIIYQYKGLSTPSCIAMNSDYVEPEPWEDCDIHMKFKAANGKELVVYRHQDVVDFYIFFLNVEINQ